MMKLLIAILLLHTTLGSLDLSDVVNPDPKASQAALSAQYNPELFEGDVISGSGGNSRKSLSKRGSAVSKKRKLWPEAKLPYVLHSSVGETVKQNILDAIADYHEHTCVKISPRVDERDYVEFTSTDGRSYTYPGCIASSIGKDYKGKMVINLQDGPCSFKGLAIHEIMHALGFHHEQSRSDRDKYIEIVWDNLLDKSMKGQYKKVAEEDEDQLGMEYDYSSIMHYSGKAFAKQGAEVIKTLDPTKQDKIGQRAGFSKQDIQEINKLYKCSGKTSGVTGKIVKKKCTDTGKRCRQFLRTGKGFCLAKAGLECQDTCGNCD